MTFTTYEPDFKSAEQVREMLIQREYFSHGEVSTRSVVLALEVLDSRHGIGKGPDGYEVTDDHLPIVAQYIDSDEVINCAVDVY